MKRMTGCVALLAAVLSSSAFAQQKYPVRAVRVVLPFAAGSAVDVLARLYAQRMSENWGQQVIVDNRTGANGIIGMEAIARAARGQVSVYTGISQSSVSQNTCPMYAGPVRPRAPMETCSSSGLAAMFLWTGEAVDGLVFLNRSSRDFMPDRMPAFRRCRG